MIIVTGGAGFIGSCVVAGLNAMGREDLMVVDHWDGPDDIKRRNLENKRFTEYLDKGEFRKYIRTNPASGKVQALIHLGACSSTTLDDAAYYEDNNFAYTCEMAEWALQHNVRFIYASSAATYGNGECGYSDADENTRKLKPLNLYGMSKHKFDLLVLKKNLQNRIVGLKYFNVFGPNEYHKGDMRSVVVKAYPRVAGEGKIALFKSYKTQFADGEQKRDFLYVKDAVDMTLFFLEHPQVNGIYNVGSGVARSWNDLARALFAAVGKPLSIEYIDMPESLKSKYQYFTQAEMGKMRQAGYAKSFIPLEDAVKDYVRYLSTNHYL